MSRTIAERVNHVHPSGAGNRRYGNVGDVIIGVKDAIPNMAVKSLM